MRRAWNRCSASPRHRKLKMKISQLAATIRFFSPSSPLYHPYRAVHRIFYHVPISYMINGLASIPWLSRLHPHLPNWHNPVYSSLHYDFYIFNPELKWIAILSCFFCSIPKSRSLPFWKLPLACHPVQKSFCHNFSDIYQSTVHWNQH